MSSDAVEQEPRGGRTCSVWVPGPILEAALPAMVEAYVTRRGPFDASVSPDPVRFLVSCHGLSTNHVV
jgi:hypothetical protein